MTSLRLGILVSGHGSNLQTLLDACQMGVLDAEVVLIVSNKPEAYALTRARRNNISTLVSKEETEMIAALQKAKVDLICLAGFMKILSPKFIQAFPKRIINIHPSLLPNFPGLNAVQQALEAGVQVTGVTVHFVDTGVDTGPIILQASVNVLKNDTVESLTERIHAEEHKLYPKAIQLIATGEI